MTKFLKCAPSWMRRLMGDETQRHWRVQSLPFSTHSGADATCGLRERAWDSVGRQDPAELKPDETPVCRGTWSPNFNPDSRSYW